MTRVGVVGLLLSASFLFSCNPGGVCKGDVCYSPVTLTCTVGSACSAAAPSVNGLKPTTFSVHPGLPPGLSLDPATGEIKGTPSQATRATHFAVKAANGEGSRTGTFEITVTDIAPATLSYDPASLTCTKGTSCGLSALTVTGGRPTSFTVSPALPPGLSISSTSGIISGAATAASAQATYSVSAANAAGQATATLTITVTEPPVGALNYPTTAIICSVGQPCVVAAPKSLGGAATQFAVAPALPAGLSFDTATGAISGTPTAPAASAVYVVTAGAASQSLTLLINDRPAAGLRYAAALVCKRGQPCASPPPENTGGTAVRLSLSPALPSGLSFDAATGIVSGTPKVVQASTPYRVTASNSGGTVAAVLFVQIDEVPPLTLVYSPATLGCTEGTACTTTAPTSTGGPITGFESTPPLPRGLNLDPATGTIGGTPIGGVTQTSYTITGKNAAGAATAMVSITVAPIVPGSILYAPASLRCNRNRACASSAPFINGGAPASYAISPLLPGGLSINSNGVIGGTAAALSSNTSYTVTGTNPLGTVTTNVSIEVVPEQVFDIIYPKQVTCTRSLPCIIAAPTYSGDPATNFYFASGVPTGLVIDALTGAISGTPTVGTDAQTIYVYGYNAGGGEYGIFTLTVVDFAPTSLVYSPSTKACATNNPNTCTLGRPTNSGGRITRFSIEPPLPSGKYIDQNSGIFYGTPYVESPLTIYTVTGTNSGGSTTATVSLSVATQPTSNLRFTPSLGCFKNRYCQVNATFDGSPPTQLTFSPALPSWASNGATYVAGQPTQVMSPTTFAVTATNPSGTTTGELKVAVFETPAERAINANATLSNFTGVGIHPTNGSVMYARAVTNDVYGTTNGGTSWKRLCHARPASGSSGSILVSPSGHAFTSNGYQVDRIEDVSGADCTALTQDVRYTGPHDEWFAFTSTGRVYTWHYTSGLMVSDDDGSTFTRVGGLGTYYRSLAVDPFNQTRVVSVQYPQDSNPGGIYAGAGSLLNATFNDYSNGPVFNRKYEGYITMRMSGFHTNDNGLTWSYAGDYGAMAIDDNGAGYRVGHAAGAPAVLKAPDMRTPVFASLYALPNDPTNSYTDTVKVTGNGSSLIVLTYGRAYYSTDSGATFTRLSVTLPLTGLPASSVVINEGVTYYSYGFAVARSLDNGNTWAGSAAIDISRDSSMLSNSRLVSSLADPRELYMRGEGLSGGAYSVELVHTTDGFETLDVTSGYSHSWYSWASAFAMSHTNTAIAYALGSSNAEKTENNGASWVRTSVPDAISNWSVWYPSEATVSPWSPTTVFYATGEYTAPETLFSYSDTTHTNTDISAASNVPLPNGLGVYKPTPSTFAMRVIGSRGQLSETLDGVTYSVLNSTGGLDDGNYARLLRTASFDSSFVATARIRNSELALSLDSGASWFRMSMPNCSITDLALAPGKVHLTCSGRAPLVVTVP